MKPGEHGYGVLLVLIITSLIFQLATDEGDVAHIVTILLLGGTFLAALWTSQARARPLWIAQRDRRGRHGGLRPSCSRPPARSTTPARGS